MEEAHLDHFEGINPFTQLRQDISNEGGTEEVLGHRLLSSAQKTIAGTGGPFQHTSLKKKISNPFHVFSLRGSMSL
jgi:hypothetical protein